MKILQLSRKGESKGLYRDLHFLLKVDLYQKDEATSQGFFITTRERNDI